MTSQEREVFRSDFTRAGFSAALTETYIRRIEAMRAEREKGTYRRDPRLAWQTRTDAEGSEFDVLDLPMGED